MAKKVVIIDGSAILYRSFYGVAPLKNSQGQSTQAVLGFIRSLKKVLTEFCSDFVVVAWDSRGSVRKEEYSEYKATRQAAPDELISQKKFIVQILENIGVLQLTEEGFEADDLINSLSKRFCSEGVDPIIVTPDKDLLQLVSSCVVVFDPFKNAVMDEKKVEEDLGFPPSKVNFYHSLLGDSSDNIPGVSKVGKTSASKLVTQFESLDQLYHRIDEVEPARVRNALIEGKDKAYLSKSLFDLRDIDCSGVELDGSRVDLIKWENATDIFLELELKTLLPKLASKPAVVDPVLDVTLVQSLDDLEQLVDLLSEQECFAFDLETSGLSWWQEQVVGISFAFGDEQIYYLPLGHYEGEQLEPAVVYKVLAPIFANPNVLKIAHNLKFDWHFLSNAGNIEIVNIFDTAIAARLTLPEWIKVGLKSLSVTELGVERAPCKDVIKEFGPDFRYVPISRAAQYSGLDSLQALQLHNVFRERLAQDFRIEEAFWDLEMPLLPVLLKMEERGICFDSDLAKSLERNVDEQIAIVEEKIFGFEGVDRDLNLNSPKQLKTLLFETLHLPVLKKGGKISTDVEALMDLKKFHPIPGLILEYRKFAKLKSTYFQGLQGSVNPQSNAIHTSFSQIMVSTGRLSSVEPNLQNVPNSQRDGANVRSCFVPRSGMMFLSADYSQIELRVLAHLTQDEGLVKAFNLGEDIHRKTAATIFNKPVDDISSEERGVAKRINFSVLYGLSAFRLAKEMEVSAREAQDYIDAFFQTYPGVRIWMDKLIEQASADGFIRTLAGRKRWFGNLQDRNALVAKAERRAAINAVAQGSAAELIKMAMIQVEKYLKAEGASSRILLQVHDELLIECPKDDLPAVSLKVQEIMKRAVSWDVPLEVSLKSGGNWGAMV